MGTRDGAQRSGFARKAGIGDSDIGSVVPRCGEAERLQLRRRSDAHAEITQQLTWVANPIRHFMPAFPRNTFRQEGAL